MKSVITVQVLVGIFDVKVTTFRNGRKANVRWFDSNDYAKAQKFANEMRNLNN